MGQVAIYLNFMGDTEEAFAFYRSVFGGEFTSFTRMSEVPGDPSNPLPEDERDKVMHVALPILDGTVLMGTDMLRSMGHELRVGNNTTINLMPDTLEETQRLFDALSEGATDVNPLQLMFWGDHWGTCLDRFGVRWMFTHTPAAQPDTAGAEEPAGGAP